MIKVSKLYKSFDGEPARRSHDGYKFAFLDVNAHAVEGRCFHLFCGEYFEHIGCLNHFTLPCYVIAILFVASSFKLLSLKDDLVEIAERIVG